MTTHVLVVEDDDDLREMLAELLTESGFRVTQATNGVDALAALDAERPTVILLDYMMPVMNGALFRRAQRARPEIAGIPVVLMTAAARVHDVEEIAPAAVLEKPFAPEAVLACLRRTALGRAA